MGTKNFVLFGRVGRDGAKGRGDSGIEQEVSVGLGGLQELVEMGLGPVKNRGFGSALVTE